MIGFITLPLYYLLFYNQFLLNKNTDIGLVGFVNVIVCGYFAFSIFVGIYLSINDRKHKSLYIPYLLQYVFRRRH